MLQSMAFMAMMVAINAILSLVSTLLPLSSIFLMVLVPLTSAMVAVYCKARYYPIYLLATIGICIGVTAWNFQSTLFYVIPGLCTGFVYGLSLSLKFPSPIAIFLCAAVQTVFFYLSLLLIKAIYGVDMVTFLLNLINLKPTEAVTAILLTFAFGYSLCEVALANVVISMTMDKMHMGFGDDEALVWIYPLISLGFIALGFGFVFFLPNVGYLMFACGIYFAIYGIRNLNPLFHGFIVGVALFLLAIFIFLFAILYSKMPGVTGLSLISLLFVGVDFVAFLNHLLLRRKGADPKI